MCVCSIRKMMVLNRLECAVQVWSDDHGDEFPNLRDLCAQIADQIDKERGIA